MVQRLRDEAHRQIQKEELEAQRKSELDPFDKEGHYVTIDEVLYEDNKLHSQTQHILPLHKLTKAQNRSLQVRICYCQLTWRFRGCTKIYT